MEQKKIFSVTERQKALEAGFIHFLRFIDGTLVSQSNPESKYHPVEVSIACFPCALNEHNVYRIEIPDGIKCIAIIDWTEFQSDDY